MARKFIILVATFFIVLNVMLVVMVLLRDSSPPPRPLPNPNGYDDFVKAGQMVSLGTNDYTKLTQNELAALVAANGQALKLARTGLSRECRVPDDYSTNYVNALLPQLLSFKELARLFCEEGRLAELENRTNDATKMYMDGIRFGQECSRGGVIISRLVGVACETISLSPLQRLTGALNGAQRREVAHALELISTNEEPIEATFAHEQKWANKMFGLKGQLEALLTRAYLQSTRDRLANKVQANILRTREMTLAFAAQAYELEKGKQPQKAADLVPEYLKAVPKDPATGKDLVVGP